VFTARYGLGLYLQFGVISISKRVNNNHSVYANLSHYAPQTDSTYKPQYIQFTVHTIHSTYNPRYIQSTVRTIHSTYNPQYIQSTVHTIHSTYNPLSHNNFQFQSRVYVSSPQFLPFGSSEIFLLTEAHDSSLFCRNQSVLETRQNYLHTF